MRISGGDTWNTTPPNPTIIAGSATSSSTPSTASTPSVAPLSCAGSFPANIVGLRAAYAARQITRGICGISAVRNMEANWRRYNVNEPSRISPNGPLLEA